MFVVYIREVSKIQIIENSRESLNKFSSSATGKVIRFSTASSHDAPSIRIVSQPTDKTDFSRDGDISPSVLMREKYV